MTISWYERILYTSKKKIFFLFNFSDQIEKNPSQQITAEFFFLKIWNIRKKTRKLYMLAHSMGRASDIVEGAKLRTGRVRSLLPNLPYTEIS